MKTCPVTLIGRVGAFDDIFWLLSNGVRRPKLHLLSKNVRSTWLGKMLLVSRSSASLCRTYCNWSLFPRSFFLHTKSATWANKALPSTYKCVIMLVLNEVVFLRDPLHCCTVFQYLIYIIWSLSRECAFVTRTTRVVFESNLHFLTSRIASLFAASARSWRVVLENSRIALVIRSGR